ncbi:MAG TPA: DNA polymerase, partial [Mesotoga infera]|nr:DNA polymerase [Mesotoga infera]
RNLFGDGINLNSPKQLLEALEKRGIKTDKTDAATLKSMEKKHPEASVILRYRKASKAVSTFTEKLPGFIHPVTGRIHPSYWQLGAATGRFSCSNPNLQQIPNELRFRECFIPAPGNKFVIADYSQIELRVAAAISRDPVMLKAYRTGEDLHRQTAAILTGKDPADIDKKERQLAKAVNFGLLFAMGARGLSDYAENSYGVKMSVREAEEFKGKFFDHYTGLRDWHKCTKSGSYYEARTLKGRRRLWSTVSSLNERLNMPVQGTAADIMKIALARLPKALKGTEAKLVAIIHDEIILEVPEDKAEEAKRMLVTVMESAGDGFIDIPLVAEAAIADSWAGKA